MAFVGFSSDPSQSLLVVLVPLSQLFNNFESVEYVGFGNTAGGDQGGPSSVLNKQREIVISEKIMNTWGLLRDF